MLHGTLHPHWSLPNIDQFNQGRIRVRILQLQQVKGFPPLFKLQLIFDQVGIPLFCFEKKKVRNWKKKKEAWIPRGNTWSHWHIKDPLLLCLLLIFNFISILPYETDKLANMCLVRSTWFSRVPFSVEPPPFIWNTFIWGTAPFRGQNLIPEKCSHNLCTCYLYSRDNSVQGKETLFLSPKTGFNLPSGDTLKKRLTTKSVDNFKFTLVTMTTASTTPTISLKLMYFACGNATHNNAEIS